MIAINMKTSLLLPLMMTSIFFIACQPKDTASHLENSTQQDAAVQTLPVLIQAKTLRLNNIQTEVCHAATTEDDFASCTKYHLQSIETNLDWLNDYFMQRLQSDYAEAFEPSSAVNVTLDPNMPSTNYSTASVRYIGQHAHLASFEYFNDYFPAGAAHGMYSSEYVTFDLRTKQRLSLNDILLPATKEKLKAELYSYNSAWLEDHHIAESELNISENYYYGANGLVFVYPLYELASYAEGLSELELPYWAAQALIQPQYLPQLPASTEEIYTE